MFPPFFLLAFVVNMLAVLLTLRFFSVLFAGKLNAAGRQAIEGIPTNPVELLNSGLPAIKMVGVLYTRQYKAFGDAKVSQAGDLAFVAQMAALVGTMAVFGMTARRMM